MRIGMMADTYKPHISGITTYISLNKQALEKAGHEVYVFTFGDEDYKDEETNVIRNRGVPIIDTGYYLNLGYKREARKLLKTMDIVHLHHPFLSGSIGLRICRPRRIPLVFTNHTRYDLYAQAYLPALPYVISETMLQAYMPAFCRACNRVVAPSAGMRNVLLRLGVDVEIHVIPNGVNLKPYLVDHQLIERQKFGIDHEDVVLIYVGRLGPEKNLPFLLRSFAGAAHAYEKVRLLIVGDGPERKISRIGLKGWGSKIKVVFTGMVPYQSLPGYLQMADAFVTASVTEVHPLSVIEAMAAGLPVLGIDSPGVGDTILDGVTGLISSEDLAKFTAQMVRLVSQPIERKEMGWRARQESEQYSIERTSMMMLDLYEETITEAQNKKLPLRTKFSHFFEDWFVK
jgi:1,2-diacylglycerol 3-alpha-glucosyltransferase